VNALVDRFANLEVLALIYPQLIAGSKMTAYLIVAVIPPGIIAGLLIATVHSLRIRCINWLIILYVDFFRSFPPLVLLIFVYYGVPFFGIELNPFLSVVIAFTLNSSSFFGEVFRAGIESIPRGQMEAARSTGLTRPQALCYVILPQAVRNVASDLVGNVLEVVKLTAIASVVVLPELLRMAQIAAGNTYNPTPIIAAALIYLVFLWPVVRLLSRLERRMLVTAR
jgi:polar amino acid transport system permease protein